MDGEHRCHEIVERLERLERVVDEAMKRTGLAASLLAPLAAGTAISDGRSVDLDDESPVVRL